MQLVGTTHHERCVHGKRYGFPPAQTQGHNYVHQLSFDEGSAAALCKCFGMRLQLGHGVLAVVNTVGSVCQQFRQGCKTVNGVLAQRLDCALSELLLDFCRGSAVHVFFFACVSHIVVRDCNRNVD